MTYSRPGISKVAGVDVPSGLSLHALLFAVAELLNHLPASNFAIQRARQSPGAPKGLAQQVSWCPAPFPRLGEAVKGPIFVISTAAGLLLTATADCKP